MKRIIHSWIIAVCIIFVASISPGLADTLEVEEHQITSSSAIETIFALKGMEEQVQFEMEPYKAAEGAHAIAILTEWPEFADLDYGRIFEQMIKPAFIFDGRNILDHKRLFDMGFNVMAIGKAPLRHH